MTNNKDYSHELTILAKQKEKEQRYWQHQLTGNPVKTNFPYTLKSTQRSYPKEHLHALTFQLTEKDEENIDSKLIKLSKDSDYTLNLILITGIIFLLHKYTGEKDILVGTPIYKQKTEAQFINTVLILRCIVENDSTFKELLFQVRHTLKEANDNQNYPIETLVEKMNMENTGESPQLFNVAVLFENIHNREYLSHNCCNMIFSFKRKAQCIQGTVEYNPTLYDRNAIKGIISHFTFLLGQTLDNLDTKLSCIQFLTSSEKKELLHDFNQTGNDHAPYKNIIQWYSETVEKTPNHIAVSSPLDLSEIFSQLESETVKEPMGERIGACCFKKNPYLYSTSIKLSSGDGSFTLLKTHHHNSVTINHHTEKLLEGFDGKRNLRWIYSWIKHIEKSRDLRLEFVFYSLSKADLLEITFQTSHHHQKFCVHNFSDLVRLTQFLYKNHLIELEGVDIRDTCPKDYIIEGWEENKMPLSDNKFILQNLPGNRAQSPEARVLLLGDTPGMPTTGILYMASYLRRNGVNAVCQFYDPGSDHKTTQENIEALLENIRPSIVAISLKWFLYIARVLDMCKTIKVYARKHNLDIKVVVGGNTASFYWEEIIKNDCIDILVRGDGEEPLLKISQGEQIANIPNCIYKENGQIFENPFIYVLDESNSQGIYLSHLDEIMLSPYASLLGTFFIYTHKGCAMNCLYCGGCNLVQQKTFNRKKVLRREVESVRKDIEAIKPYASTFHFEFDIVDTQENILDYCKKIWAGIDLSGHFCVFSTLITPSESLIRLLSQTFKYVYWDYDICTFSQRHRQQLYSLGLVKPQPTDNTILEFMAQCSLYNNIKVRINLITGMPYFSIEDIEPGEELLSRIVAYPAFGELHWARLHAQPGAPIVENPGKHQMHSYALNYTDFLKFSRRNFNPDTSYPFVDDQVYPYIYFEEDQLNSKITNLYLETNRKIAQILSERGKNLIISNTLTFRELDNAAEQLCNELRAKGIKPYQLVGIMLERTIDIPVGILGIMKTGCAYMPIDPEFPEGRIEFMLKDSNSAALITTSALAEQHMSYLSDSTHTFPIINLTGLELTENPANQLSPSTPGTVVTTNSPAYLIYTSGTTGKPKGVLLSQKNLVNYVHWFSSFTNLTGKDKTILTSSFAFDLGYTSIYTSILNGAQLHILPREMYLLAERLLDYIKQQGITYLKVTPSLFSIIANNAQFSPYTCKRLRLTVIGGEAINVIDIEKAHILCPHLKIINHYGPTEATIGSVATVVDFDCIDQYKTQPVIGKPIFNTAVYILGKEMNILPIWVTGELCIAGACLGKGYLNRPELTAEKFVSKFNRTYTAAMSHITVIASITKRLYKTGDLARWLPNGMIEFLGRIDTQVKIRGYRIELGEIENRLIKHQNIENALVLITDLPESSPPDAPVDKTREKYLCAYIVPKKDIAKTKGNEKIFSINLKKLQNRHLLTTLQKFEQHVKTKGNEIAVKSDTQTLTYRRLDQLANHLAYRITTEYDDRYKLSKKERSRYKRQLLLHEWGTASQEKLKSTTVFVAGAGGGASPTLMQLALAGVGTIIICDCDVVEISNLNRQFLHDENRIGMNKALSAQITLERINPNVTVIPIKEKLTKENVFQLVGDAAIIFDMFDGMEDKFILSHCATIKKIPHIISAMTDINSYAAIFYPPKTPCYHCIFDKNKLKEIIEGMSRYMDKYEKNPLPVVATSLFMSTAFAVNEAFKIILGFDNPAYNKFMYFNQRGTETLADTQSYKAMTYNFSEHFLQACRSQGFDWEIGWRGNFLEELRISPDPNCPLCANNAKDTRNLLEMDVKYTKNTLFQTETLKKRITNDENPGKSIALLLDHSLNTATAIIAAAKARIAYTPLDPAAPLEILCYILEESEARVIVSDNKFSQLAERIRKKANQNIKIINVDNIEEFHESVEERNVTNHDTEIEQHTPTYTIYVPTADLESKIESPFYASFRELHQALEEEGNYFFGKTNNNKNISHTTFNEKLRQYLMKELPDYMIPTYFIQLEKIPLTPNGKIDIKSLPKPGTDEKNPEKLHAPETEIEKVLAEIWSEVLEIEIDRIGTNSNFFQLGGHSLKATSLISKIHQQFNLQIPLNRLFQLPTLKEISKIITTTKLIDKQEVNFTGQEIEEIII